MRAPRRLIVTIAAGALAVAGGSTLADADDGGGHGNGDGGHHGKRHVKRHWVQVSGLDWVINGKSKAKVSRDGRVRVRIEGLVFAEGPNVGKNTVPQLAATVYCGSAAAGTTKAVPFSPEGDARIDETLATAPPSPCLAPAVLINPAPAGTPVTGTYIAASGV